MVAIDAVARDFTAMLRAGRFVAAGDAYWADAVTSIGQGSARMDGRGGSHWDACKSTPLSAAKASIFSIRHFGIDPLVFQLDTVEGVRSKAFASLLVPPSAVTMSVAVFMPALLRLA